MTFPVNSIGNLISGAAVSQVSSREEKESGRAPFWASAQRAAYWQALSTGKWNAWKNKFIKPVGDRSFVKDPSRNNQIVSESMAYGMLLAVQKSDQNTFDGLLKGLKDMKGRGLPVWRGYIENEQFTVKSDGDHVSASDAEQDIAMALIQAQTLVDKGVWKRPVDPQSGKKDKKYYGRLAQDYLNMIWWKEVAKVKDKYILKPSEDWGDIPGGAIVNPSYIMPAWYDYFAAFDNNPAHRWKELKDSSYEVLNAALDKYGHIPDWCKAIHPDGAIEIYDAEGMSNRMGYDAIRVMWRVSQDAMLATDPAEKARAVELCRRIIQGLNGKKIEDIKVYYFDPDTNESGETHNSTVIAMYALAAQGASIRLPGENEEATAYFSQWADKLQNYLREDLRISEQATDRYYNESLDLFAAMIMGGKFEGIASREILPKEGPNITMIRERHLPWPLNQLEAVPVIGPWLSPSDSPSSVILSGTRSSELEMLIRRIGWLKNKNPESMRTIKIRMKFCGELTAWGYHDEAITQYLMVLENIKYDDPSVKRERAKLERRDTIRKAVRGLMGAIKETGREEEGITILSGILEKDKQNVIARAALAELLSYMPQIRHEKRAIEECLITMRLLSGFKYDESEVAAEIIMTMASINSRNAKKAAATGDFGLAMAMFGDTGRLFDMAGGNIRTEELNRIIGRPGLIWRQGDIEYVNTLLKNDQTPYMSSKITLVRADVLSGIMGELYMHAEIQADVEGNEIENSVVDFMRSNYEEMAGLYKNVPESVPKGPWRYRYRYFPSDEAKAQEGGKADLLYKASLGLMRMYSGQARLALRTGADDGGNVNRAIAINSVMLSRLNVKGILKGSEMKDLGDEVFVLIDRNMKRVRRYLRVISEDDELLRFARAETRVERMQIRNDEGEHKEAIKEYQKLLKREVPVGRIRPHFERLIFYLDNWEYEAAVADSDVLIDAIPALGSASSSGAEILDPQIEGKILEAKGLILNILQDQKHIQTGSIEVDPDPKKHTKAVKDYLELSRIMNELSETQGISSRNKKIIDEAAALIENVSGSEETISAKFGDAYSLIIRCLEVNHMFRARVVMFNEGSISQKQIGKELKIMEGLKTVKALIEEKKYVDARKLCQELIRDCENDLDEKPPVADVQRAVLLGGLPKYVEALAKSGRPLEAIAVYKQILGIDRRYVEFVDGRTTHSLDMGDDVSKVLLILGDKEIMGYADKLFRTQPHIRNGILADLAELHVWKDTQAAYFELMFGKEMKKTTEDMTEEEKEQADKAKTEIFGIAKRYFKQVDANDPTDINVVRWLRDLSLYLFWLKGRDGAEREDYEAYESRYDLMLQTR